MHHCRMRPVFDKSCNACKTRLTFFLSSFKLNSFFGKGSTLFDQVINVLLGTHMFVAGMAACFLDNTVPGQFYAPLIPTPTPLNNPHLKNVSFLSGLTAIWISIRQHDSSSTIDIYLSTSQSSVFKVYVLTYCLFKLHKIHLL